jgi:hypothetical protein
VSVHAKPVSPGFVHQITLIVHVLPKDKAQSRQLIGHICLPGESQSHYWQSVSQSISQPNSALSPYFGLMAIFLLHNTKIWFCTSWGVLPDWWTDPPPSLSLFYFLCWTSPWPILRTDHIAGGGGGGGGVFLQLTKPVSQRLVLVPSPILNSWRDVCFLWLSRCGVYWASSLLGRRVRLVLFFFETLSAFTFIIIFYRRLNYVARCSGCASLPNLE